MKQPYVITHVYYGLRRIEENWMTAPTKGLAIGMAKYKASTMPRYSNIPIPVVYGAEKSVNFDRTETRHLYVHPIRP